MSNPQLKATSTMVTPLVPLPSSDGVGRIVTSFSLATSQLAELISEYKDTGKKTTDIVRQINSVEDRLTLLENRLTRTEAKIIMPHPPTPPPTPPDMATTGDVGKAVATLKNEIMNAIAAIRAELKTLHNDREDLVKESFATESHLDTFQSIVQGSISTMATGLADILRKLSTEIGSVGTRDVQKK